MKYQIGDEIVIEWCGKYYNRTIADVDWQMYYIVDEYIDRWQDWSDDYINHEETLKLKRKKIIEML